VIERDEIRSIMSQRTGPADVREPEHDDVPSGAPLGVLAARRSEEPPR
jgi:hypothetical protein